MPGTKCCAKSQRVEMAAMIRCEHKRPVRGEFVAADDRESMRDCEVNSQQRKTNMMSSGFQQTALAPHAAKAFAGTQTGITCRLKFPRLHPNFLSSKNLL